MEELKQTIDALLRKWQDQDPQGAAQFMEGLAGERVIYPFNPMEHSLAHLLDAGVLDIGLYEAVRTAYLERNKYLYLYELAPRTFGETWGQTHIQKLVPQVSPASRDLDPQYEGQYDLWLPGIRIEVKASRAVRRQSGGTLGEKALYSTSPDKFDMNFQQLKPRCADVFVWIGVWRDPIRYWVPSSAEVSGNKYYSTGQHRGNSGEGQLWIKHSNIQEFEPYAAPAEGLYEAIRRAAGRKPQP